MDPVPTNETTTDVVHITETSDDGNTILERTITREIEPDDDTPALLERVMDLESRLSKMEQPGNGRGVMEPTATETVIETPPPEEKKDEAPPAPAKGTAKSEPPEPKADEPPAKPKKRRPGFWF